MNFNCPICNQAGLDDYKTRHVICPQCNSDLKPYLLLNRVSKIKRKNIINRWIIVGLIACCLTLAFFLLYENPPEEKIVVDTQEIIADIQEIVIDTQEIVADTQEITIEYEVKEGDTLWEIAKNHYGDGKLYTKIEADNNLREPYTLKAGQMLNIKIYRK